MRTLQRLSETISTHPVPPPHPPPPHAFSLCLSPLHAYPISHAGFLYQLKSPQHLCAENTCAVLLIALIPPPSPPRKILAAHSMVVPQCIVRRKLRPPPPPLSPLSSRGNPAFALKYHARNHAISTARLPKPCQRPHSTGYVRCGDKKITIPPPPHFTTSPASFLLLHEPALAEC